MRHGFSLVELSIVLVILGLLTGGILAGQSLIRAAELRAVTTEFNRYITAAQTFRDKYFALPGDMTNAQSFWGVAHATPATCVTTPGTGTQTCNGDGDGRVVPSTGSNEGFRYWQHLANAGLIEGTYSGVQDGTTNYSATANNAPRSRFNNGYWFAWYWTDGYGAAGMTFQGNYGNFLEFGGLVTNSDSSAVLLKPEEMWNIDTKMDDGMPATGKLWARRYNTCTNGASVTDYAATYLLTSNAAACAALFRQVY